MATEKRLIDVNEAKKKLRAVREWFVGHPSSEQDHLAQAVAKLCIEEIEKVKPADAVEVVRCKDCVYWENGKDYTPYCNCFQGLNEPAHENCFCCFGERKENRQ